VNRKELDSTNCSQISLLIDANVTSHLPAVSNNIFALQLKTDCMQKSIALFPTSILIA